MHDLMPLHFLSLIERLVANYQFPKSQYHLVLPFYIGIVLPLAELSNTSYIPLMLIGATGFEPATSASRTLRSDQAELRPVGCLTGVELQAFPVFIGKRQENPFPCGRG